MDFKVTFVGIGLEVGAVSVEHAAANQHKKQSPQSLGGFVGSLK